MGVLFIQQALLRRTLVLTLMVSDFSGDKAIGVGSAGWPMPISGVPRNLGKAWGIGGPRLESPRKMRESVY